MKKKKILVITGTRAEYGYLRPVLSEIRKSTKLELRLLVTGMHTLKRCGKTINEIKKDAMPIVATVPIGENDSMLEALAKEIRGIERYCMKERPDLMLVIADRDEPFAGAIVAGHLGIPLVHLAGGDSTGYVVDEPIRHSISKFAHIHFTWTPKTATRLRALGEEPRRIHVTGSTSFDDIRTKQTESRTSLARTLKLDAEKPWLLFVQHPTPLDATPLSEQIKYSVASLRACPGEKIILYPNTDTGSDLFVKAIESLTSQPNTHLFTSLPHTTYLSLLKHCVVIIGNSSSGVIEAGFFGTPAVDIGGRQHGREHGGNVIHAPYDTKKISAAIKRALSPAFTRKAHTTKHPFDRGHASKKIVRVLEKLRIDEKLLHKHIKV